MDSQEIKRALKIKEVVRVLERIDYSADDKIVSVYGQGQDIEKAEVTYGVVTVASVVAAGLTPTVYGHTSRGGLYRFEVSNFPLGHVTEIVIGGEDDIVVGQAFSLFDWARIDASNIPLPVLNSVLHRKAAAQTSPINYRMKNENIGQTWRNYDAVMSADAVLQVCGLEFWAAIRAAIKTGEMVGFSVEFADHRVLIEKVG